MFIAFVYMLAQVLCVIDFSYKWNESWTDGMEANWLAAGLAFSGVFILTSLYLLIQEYVRLLVCTYPNSDGFVDVISTFTSC